MSRMDLYGLFSFGDALSSAASVFLNSLKTIIDTVKQVSHTIKHFLSFPNQIQSEIDSFAIDIFGTSFLNFSGYFTGQQETGSYGHGELSDKFRITFINGILNTRYDNIQTLQLFSQTHGGVNIHYIFHPTDGWSHDIMNCVLVRFGYVSQQAHQLASLWKTMIKEMGGAEGGGMILHYAHSIGSGDTYAATSMLTPEEQKMIKVMTMGSPMMIPENGFASAVNYVSRRDGVCIFDPIGYLKGVFDSESNVVFLDSYLGMPFVDHLMATGSYKLIIEELGKQFVDMIKG